MILSKAGVIEIFYGKIKQKVALTADVRKTHFVESAILLLNVSSCRSLKDMYGVFFTQGFTFFPVCAMVVLDG